MKRSITFLLAALTLLIGSQAHASPLMDWTLNLTSLGGPDVTGINSLSMNGTVNLIQNVTGSPAGTPQVGDTFTLSNTTNSSSPIQFVAAAYVNNLLQQITPLLATGQGSLFLQTPQLTGTIASILPGNMYNYTYNGTNQVSLDYTNPSAVTTTLATFSLQTPNSGGLSTDNFSGGTGLQEGTSNLYGLMTVTQAGVLFNSSNIDLSTLAPSDIAMMGSLSGGLNYSAIDNGQAILATIASDDNFTIDSGSPSSVPEPISMVLLGGGTLFMSLLGRRGRKNMTA